MEALKQACLQPRPLARQKKKKRGYMVCTGDYVATNTRRIRLQRTHRHSCETQPQEMGSVCKFRHMAMHAQPPGQAAAAAAKKKKKRGYMAAAAQQRCRKKPVARKRRQFGALLT
jgi:hypothetical protein